MSKKDIIKMSNPWDERDNKKNNNDTGILIFGLGFITLIVGGLYFGYKYLDKK